MWSGDHACFLNEFDLFIFVSLSVWQRPTCKCRRNWYTDQKLSVGWNSQIMSLIVWCAFGKLLGEQGIGSYWNSYFTALLCCDLGPLSDAEMLRVFWLFVWSKVQPCQDIINHIFSYTPSLKFCSFPPGFSNASCLYYFQRLWRDILHLQGYVNFNALLSWVPIFDSHQPNSVLHLINQRSPRYAVETPPCLSYYCNTLDCSFTDSILQAWSRGVKMHLELGLLAI